MYQVIEKDWKLFRKLLPRRIWSDLQKSISNCSAATGRRLTNSGSLINESKG